MDSLFPPDCPKVRIRILGEPFEVPAGLSLLRGFQFLSPVEVSRGRFCWNAECGSSSFGYRMPGDAADREGRACRVIAVEGMSVTRLSPELTWALRAVLPAAVR